MLRKSNFIQREFGWELNLFIYIEPTEAFFALIQEFANQKNLSKAYSL